MNKQIKPSGTKCILCIQFFLFILLTACSNPSATQETPASEVSEAESEAVDSKPETQNNTDPEILNLLSGKWTIITEEEGKRFIMEYCDAAPESVSLEQEDEAWIVYYVYGQEGDRYEVLGATDNQNGSYELTLNNESLNQKSTVSASFENEEKETTIWKGFYEDGVKRTYASTTYVETGQIPIIKEECDDMP